MLKGFVWIAALCMVFPVGAVVLDTSFFAYNGAMQYAVSQQSTYFSQLTTAAEKPSKVEKFFENKSYKTGLSLLKMYFNDDLNTKEHVGMMPGLGFSVHIDYAVPKVSNLKATYGIEWVTSSAYSKDGGGTLGSYGFVMLALGGFYDIHLSKTSVLKPGIMLDYGLFGNQGSGPVYSNKAIKRLNIAPALEYNFFYKEQNWFIMYQRGLMNLEGVFNRNNQVTRFSFWELGLRSPMVITKKGKGKGLNSKLKENSAPKPESKPVFTI